MTDRYKFTLADLPRHVQVMDEYGVIKALIPRQDAEAQVSYGWARWISAYTIKKTGK